MADLDSRGEKFNIHGRSDSRAIDILKVRYARGEMNKAEFEANKKDLKD
jgi:uncharacterized membrane protein